MAARLKGAIVQDARRPAPALAPPVPRQVWAKNFLPRGPVDMQPVARLVVGAEDPGEGHVQVRKAQVHTCIAFCCGGGGLWAQDEEEARLMATHVPALCQPRVRSLVNEIQAMGSSRRRPLVGGTPRGSALGRLR